ncbi:MAG: hypothetical protein ACMXYM_02855 [Candidatus Woesearchaeota archaeon]
MIHPAYLFIGLLALSACFFGAFDQQRFTDERCVGDTTKFACIERTVSLDADGTVTIQLQNGAGESVRITRVSTNNDCGIEEPPFTIVRDGVDVTGQVLEPDDGFSLVVGCEPFPQDSKFDEAFVIHYGIVDGVTNLRGTVEAVVLT